MKIGCGLAIAAAAVVAVGTAAATPSVRVASPPDLAFARGVVHLDARCTTCSKLEAHFETPTGALLAAGTTRIDQLIDVSSGDHAGAYIYITGTDATGTTTQHVRVYPESETRLVEVTGGVGMVSSFDAQRLILDYAPNRVLLDRATGIVRPVGGDAELTSRGAIWQGGEWRDGVSVPNAATTRWHVAGRWAVWTSTKAAVNWPQCSSLPCVAMLLDVETGATTTALSGGTAMAVTDVAPNGDILLVWMPPGYAGYPKLYRVRAGVAEQIYGASTGGSTDGSTIVLRSRTSLPRYSLIMTRDDGQGALLATFESGGDAAYRIDNGWVAFESEATRGAPRSVWRMAPDGVRTQVSTVLPSSLHAVGANGDVILQEQSTRKLVSATGQPTEALSRAGNYVFFEGVWHLELGGSVLRRLPSGTAVEPDLLVSRGDILVPVSGAAASVRPISGGGASLSFTAATLEGPDASKFSIASDGCSGKTLAPATTCVVSVTTTASFGSAIDASLVLTTNDVDEPTRRLRLVVAEAVAGPSSGPDAGAPDSSGATTPAGAPPTSPGSEAPAAASPREPAAPAAGASSSDAGGCSTVGAQPSFVGALVAVCVLALRRKRRVQA